MCNKHLITELIISTLVRRIPTLTGCIQHCSCIITGSKDKSFFAIRRTIGTTINNNGGAVSVLIHPKMCRRCISVPRSSPQVRLIGRAKTRVESGKFARSICITPCGNSEIYTVDCRLVEAK